LATSRSPLRIDAELLASAASAAAGMSRSAAQQINHWARIGRELERSPDVSLHDVMEVLRGAAAYDALGSREQAVVRAAWAERARSLHDELRLDRDFAAAGVAYAELDARGRVVVREPSSPARTRTAARRRKR
jgi:hypothetical protein